VSQLAERPVSSRPPDGQRSRVRRLAGAHESGVLVATLTIFAVCALTLPNFLDTANLLSIAQQIALIGIVGVGMTFVIVSGEIDLSVGSQFGFLSVFLAWLVTVQGIPVGPAALITVLVGLLIGLVQGLVVTLLSVPSFVVTLAGLSVLRGAALLVSKGVPVNGSSNQTFRSVTGGTLFGSLTAQTLWMAGLLIIFGWVLARTKFGYDVYASGGNRRAASQAGIRTAVVKTSCFALTGACSGLAAVILVGWLGSANPLTGSGFELSVIAAVVVGGAGLAGGVGSITGTFFGAVVAGMIANALTLSGIDGNWQPVATGLLILGAVLINRFVGIRQTNLR